MDALLVLLTPLAAAISGWPEVYKRSLADCFKLQQAIAPLSEDWTYITTIVHKPPPGFEFAPWHKSYASIPIPGTQASKTTKPKQVVEFASWNCKGFLTSWRSGKFRKMINSTSPDILQISELKCSLMDIMTEFKNEVFHWMHSAGYHCYFHWADDPGKTSNKWGNALFSKILPSDVSFGLGSAHANMTAEGRFILATYEHFSVAGSYSPFSD